MKMAEKDTFIELPLLFDFQRNEALSVFITICTFSVLSFAGRGSKVNWGTHCFLITLLLLLLLLLFVCLFIYLFRGTRDNLKFPRNCYHRGVIYRTSGPDSGLHLIMRLRPPHVDPNREGV